jgi:hypothetical protein
LAINAEGRAGVGWGLSSGRRKAAEGRREEKLGALLWLIEKRNTNK